MALPSYATSLISSVVRVQQDTDTPQFVIGGRQTSSYALFKKGTTYDFTLWRSQVFTTGKPFDVLEIKFATNQAISGNIEIIPVLYFDNEVTSSVGTAINATNYTNSEKLIKLTSKNFSNAVSGFQNFFLELQFTGTSLVTVKCPITIDVEIKE